MWGRFLATLALIALPMPVFAWSADGHRAVCLLAWEQMTGAAKSRALELLGASGEKEFADVCPWADEILGARPETSHWHGVSLPTAARFFDMMQDCPQSNCVIAQVEHHVAVLKSAAPRAEKAESLRFLAHLVGDLHQPVNIGFTDHLSGRQISGMFHGRLTNLHAVWDQGLLATFVPPGKDGAKIIFDVSAWTGRLDGADKKTPLAWANETVWVAIAPPTGYLGNQGGDFFGEHYIRQNRTIALEQIDKAGVHLADMLNEALK